MEISFESNEPSCGPKSFLNSTFWFNPYGTAEAVADADDHADADDYADADDHADADETANADDLLMQLIELCQPKVL